jgi:hypothetical protein
MSLHLVTVPGVATLCTEGLVGHSRKTTMEYIGPTRRTPRAGPRRESGKLAGDRFESQWSDHGAVGY